MGRKKKIAKYIFPAIGLLVVLLTVLNLYLSHRLERYLKKELSRRTAEATVYRFRERGAENRRSQAAARFNRVRAVES